MNNTKGIRSSSLQMQSLLRADAINYRYTSDRQILQDVSLTVQTRSVTFLLGHNGCGKTTLLELLSGVRAMQQGVVFYRDENLHRLAASVRAQRVGLVPQIHAPMFAYTVRDVVMMGRTPYMGFLGTPGRTDAEIVDAAIVRVGLEAFRDRAYTELSGGERQLTLIARGLAQQTNVLLLDEPAAHLDPGNQHTVLETIVELARQDVAFVISSHNPNSALLYADQVAVMKAGRILTRGTPQTVLTEDVLATAYDMAMDVIAEGGVTRAILPRRMVRHDAQLAAGGVGRNGQRAG